MNAVMIIMQALNGLTIAAIYILLASGLTIVLGLQRIVNIAHGFFYMIGAYISVSVVAKMNLSFWFSLPVAFLCAALLGAVLEILGIRSLLRWKREHHHAMILTLGIALGGGEVVKMIWGAIPQLATVPASFQGVLVAGPIIYPKYWLFVVVLTIFIMAAIWVFFNMTDLGIMVRAVAADNDTAQALGTRAPMLNTLVFAFGTGLAGVAGVLAAPILGVDPNMGMELLLILFVVIILGGLGSLMGAMISAVLIGLVMSFGTAFISGTIAKILVFATMIVILIISPSGLIAQGKEID